MTTKEECEMEGGIWVSSHISRGSSVRGYCRKRSELEYKPKNVPMDLPMNEVRPMPHEMPHESLTNDEAFGRTKISSKHLKTAKLTERNIRIEDRKIKRDLREQDFPDIPYQSYRLAKDAEKEAQEGNSLEKFQKTKSLESMERVRSKRAKSEYRSEKSKRRHAKKAGKRENKLERLREKS